MKKSLFSPLIPLSLRAALDKNYKDNDEEFEDWQLRVPFDDGDVQVLCCPEDLVCKNEACMRSRMLRDDCKMPVCEACRWALNETEAPHRENHGPLFISKTRLCH
mgnify:CR=1 FL=1